MKIKVLLSLILLLNLSGDILFGQEQMPYRLQTEMIGSGGLSFEFWKAKADKITEFSIPLMMIYPYSPKLRLYGITSPAFSSLNTGQSYSLSGLSDIKVGGHYLIANDQWLLTFGINLPTGKSALKSEEYAVASVMTIPAFNFRVPSLGQGLDLQLGISGAHEMGNYKIGYGVSYLLKGGFKPFQDVDDAYNPGDELSFTLGADRQTELFGKTMRLTGDILYSMYFNDTWAKEKVFKSGNRLMLQVMSVFKHGRSDVVILIRDRIKGKNKTGAGDFFETERKNSNGNQFEIQGYTLYPYRQNIQLKGILDVKLYSNSDYGTGGATLFGFGGGGKKRLSPQLVLNGEARMYLGKLKTAAESVSTFGLKIFGGLEYTF